MQKRGQFLQQSTKGGLFSLCPMQPGKLHNINNQYPANITQNNELILRRNAFLFFSPFQECLVGSTPKTPKVGQVLGFIPRWGPIFKIKLEVLIETYEYFDNEGNILWGQIARFQAQNGTGAEGADNGGDCCDVGSRVPSIFAKIDEFGENVLHVTSAIFNDYSVEKDLTGNFVFNFTGETAPDTDKYFFITITQLPIQKEIQRQEY